MNKEFEKLPCVAKKLERAHFVEKDGVYYPNDWNLEVDRECAEWLDGALYAYQEQQSLKTEAYITLGESLNHGSRAYEEAIYEAMNILRESKDDTETNQR